MATSSGADLTPSQHKGKPIALYLFAGTKRKSDVGEYLRKSDWEVLEIDILLNRNHDLSKLSVRNDWLEKIKLGRFAAVIASPPCDTFSRVTFANNYGPAPVRTMEHKRGFPWLVGEKKRRVLLGNILADFAFEAILAQIQQDPGIGVMEFPEDLGAVRHGQWHGVRPASIWQWDLMESVRNVTNVHEYGIFQSDFQAPYLKPTRIMLKGTATAATAYKGPPTFDEAGFYTGPLPRANAKSLGLQTLAKKAGESGFRTTGTAAWAPDLCKWVADSIVHSWQLAGDSDKVMASSGSLQPDASSHCLSAYPTFLPQAGYWMGGSGPPRQTYMMGKSKEYHDGAGLTSPGRWAAKDRIYPQGRRWDNLRQLLHQALLEHQEGGGKPWGAEGIQRALLRLCCTPKSDVFLPSLVEKGRKIIKTWLKAQCADFDELEADIAEGQPFLLNMMYFLLRDMGDADYKIFHQFKTGVTAGIMHPLPRNPAIFEEQVTWRLPSEVTSLREAENYVSLDLFKEQVESLFKEEELLGMMTKCGLQEFHNRFGVHTAISALAVIEEQGGAKIRVLHDGTNTVHLNNRIRSRDKLRMPGVPEKHVQMRERRGKGEMAISLLLDYSKAHRRVKILEEEQGYLGCKLDEQSIWFNRCGTFGIGSASYWWARLAGGQLRLLHGLLGPRWPIEALLYADDLEMTAADSNEREGIVMAVFVLLILGAPLKLSKFRGGFKVEWVGMYIDNTLFSIGLSLCRARWLVNWARQVIDTGSVEVTNFAGGVGRLGFASNALLYEKPWLGPLYAWSSTIQLAGRRTAAVPWGIKFILYWIAKRLESDCRIMVTPCLPRDRGYLFKSDAKAEDGRATIGGWECRDGTPPRLAKWFFVELFQESSPWVFAKQNDPQRIIATLELLGTLLCLILFDFRSTDLRRGIHTVSGTTDNQGNTMALQKCMSTKWPLAPMLIELAEQLRSRNLELHLDWERRDKNVDADSITNEDFTGFDEKLRVQCDFPKIPWVILDQAMIWSKEIYDITQERKQKVVGQPFVPKETWKRRKTAANKRLRATDPW